MIDLLALSIFGLLWGSFLNMIAYRLMSGDSLFIARSFCQACKKTIAWYDLIPLFSWIILKRRCRYCKARISWLYPFIEGITAVVVPLIYLCAPFEQLPGALFFVSALIITIRTDFEHMLINQLVTLFLIPFMILLSFGYSPVTPAQSILGALTGYAVLFAIRGIHMKLSGKEGMGLGDVELLSFIGSFLGIAGWWSSLMIGSLVGSVTGIVAMSRHQSLNVKIPFGPYLALGAILTLIGGYYFHHPLLSFFTF